MQHVMNSNKSQQFFFLFSDQDACDGLFAIAFVILFVAIVWSVIACVYIYCSKGEEKHDTVTQMIERSGVSNGAT